MVLAKRASMAVQQEMLRGALVEPRRYTTDVKYTLPHTAEVATSTLQDDATKGRPEVPVRDTPNALANTLLLLDRVRAIGVS